MIEGACHCGAVTWVFRGEPDGATACNCTICRRYGVLWIYDYDGEGIAVGGPTTEYVRGSRSIGFHFCPTCGCVAAWRAREAAPDGRVCSAVNVRLAAPEAVAHLPICHFDGLVGFDDLPRDGKCVADLWA
ncbi:MAG: GFA family protein [Defluviimonas sp.]|uniref:GFA family protein n=1 Tax=Albidovulum sp. TaxID=1872424 RepID=UPI001E088440|nr:GFA family protein [Paracoccaceae bacterium]MCC0063893.1 GFA family protein [Defluviimonas sp.]